MVITHRGKFNNGTNENTIPAFEAALKAGADAVECDLRLTKDNQAVVYHDSNLSINGKRLKVSKTSLKNLKSISKRHSGLSRISLHHMANGEILESQASPDPQNDEFERANGLLTINDLFDFINQKRVPFFLEAKTRSPILIETIVKQTQDRNLWSYVHIMGFSLFIKNALRAQAKHEKLRVLPIINFPLYSYIKKPPKSYGLFIGWIDQWYGSGLIFRKLISAKRLTKLKNFYQDKGFKVMAGVINNKTGFEYFKKAGIEDIVTDNIKDAVGYFKK